MLVCPAGATDAIATGSGAGVTLGARWGPHETFAGASFRWVDNDAEIQVRGGAALVRILIACEGGPSLGVRSFALRVLDAARRQVDHVECDGPTRPQTMVLPVGASDQRYVLHVDGGGKRLPNVARVLNFRVFSLSDERRLAADVVEGGSGLRLGPGWYPLERFAGQTFRWMAGEGRIDVAGAGSGALTLLVEAGPGAGPGGAPVSIRDARGAELVRTVVRGSRRISAPVRLHAGNNEFTVAVKGANRHVAGDPRVLNLRLFDAAFVPR